MGKQYPTRTDWKTLHESTSYIKMAIIYMYRMAERQGLGCWQEKSTKYRQNIITNNILPAILKQVLISALQKWGNGQNLDNRDVSCLIWRDMWKLLLLHHSVPCRYRQRACPWEPATLTRRRELALPATPTRRWSVVMDQLTSWRCFQGYLTRLAVRT